jgi:ubiquinone biosynthesis protein Coq4
MRLHDLHHVATGFSTDFAGEGEISAWELRRGVRELGLYVGALVVTGAMLGVMVAPRRTLRAFHAARGSHASLYRSAHSYEDVLAMSIGALRRELELAQTGVTDDGCCPGSD